MIYKTIATLALLTAIPSTWAETRELSDFDAVAYMLPFDVEFVISDEPYVTLEGDQDTIDEVITEVEDGTLRITKNDGWFDWSDEEIYLTIGYQRLTAISMSGSGDGYAKEVEADDLSLRIAGSASLEIDSLICNDLEIKIAGSGNVNLNDLEADAMTTKIAGAGDVEVSGRVVSQSISISGSGDHNARDLRSQEADIKVQGSGDVEVWAVASLNAMVMGSGDIDYYGDPEINERIMGSGSVERRGDEP